MTEDDEGRFANTLAERVVQSIADDPDLEDREYVAQDALKGTVAESLYALTEATITRHVSLVVSDAFEDGEVALPTTLHRQKSVPDREWDHDEYSALVEIGKLLTDPAGTKAVAAVERMVESLRERAAESDTYRRLALNFVRDVNTYASPQNEPDAP